MDKINLEEEMNKAIEVILSLGYAPSNYIVGKVRTYPAVSYAGLVRRKKDGRFEITISSLLIENEPEKIKDVMMHEVIHTIKGCFNHGKKFKKVAQEVYNTRLGYNVSRTINVGDWHKKYRKTYKYAITCTNCGSVIRRRVKSSVIKHPEAYRCKCGGDLERIA